MYESPQILTVKNWPSVEAVWSGWSAFDHKDNFIFNLARWFLKAFYLPCMSRIGKRSLAKAGFTAGTNNSSLFCHIYELKLQRKQQITCNTGNCVQISHSAACRAGDIISLVCSHHLCSPCLALPCCPLQELPGSFCNNLRAPQYLSLLQLKNIIFCFLEEHLYGNIYSNSHPTLWEILSWSVRMKPWHPILTHRKKKVWHEMFNLAFSDKLRAKMSIYNCSCHSSDLQSISKSSSVP